MNGIEKVNVYTEKNIVPMVVLLEIANLEIMIHAKT
jgi:hypothetical protein